MITLSNKQLIALVLSTIAIVTILWQFYQIEELKRAQRLPDFLSLEDAKEINAKGANIKYPNAFSSHSSIALDTLVDELKHFENHAAHLSVEEFANELVVLIRGRLSDQKAKASLMMRMLDPDRAIATYKAFKNKHGAGFGGESYVMKALLVQFGKNSGEEGINKLLENFPNGIPELGAYFSGWAQSDIVESISWLNDLPSDSEFYDAASHGIYWGVGTIGPDYAFKASELLDYANMEDYELMTTVKPMAGALLREHGTGSVEYWLQSLPFSVRPKAIEWALGNGNRQPASELVPWLAQHQNQSELIDTMLESKARAWAKSDPFAALNWAKSASGSINENLLDTISRTAGQE